MQRAPVSTVISVLILVLVSFQTATGSSSRSSRTESEISQLTSAIRYYRQEVGKLPAPEQYWVELQQAGMWEWSEPGRPLDRWGHPLVYRVPGKHDAFDLYSFGRDGEDNEGAVDDISSWAGVNDGFYWKEAWPRGRLALACGAVLGIACVLLGRVCASRLVAPLTGLLACIATLFGCYWRGTSGNVPLIITGMVAAILLAGLILWFIVNIRNYGLSLRVRDK